MRRGSHECSLLWACRERRRPRHLCMLLAEVRSRCRQAGWTGAWIENGSLHLGAVRRPTHERARGPLPLFCRVTDYRISGWLNALDRSALASARWSCATAFSTSCTSVRNPPGLVLPAPFPFLRVLRYTRGAERHHAVLAADEGPEGGYTPVPGHIAPPFCLVPTAVPLSTNSVRAIDCLKPVRYDLAVEFLLCQEDGGGALSLFPRCPWPSGVKRLCDACTRSLWASVVFLAPRG
jgi:hypothetical protein